MSNEQPYALLLADWLEDQYDPMGNMQMSADELRRLHALNAQMLEALQGAAVLLRVLGVNKEYPAAISVNAAIAAATGGES